MGEKQEPLTEANYAVVGEFVTKANTIEYLVNVILEMITTHIGEQNSVSNDEITYSLDEIHKQSIRTRISNIVLLLTALHPNANDVQYAIDCLKRLYKIYNKELRNMRDFVAHNPLSYVAPNARILNSRRYRSDNPIQSLDLKDLEIANAKMLELINEMSQVIGIVSTNCPVDIMAGREFTKPPVKESKTLNRPSR
jgi:hypothetical protein